MALVKFKKDRHVSDAPLISIRQGRFHYNATFGRLAEFEKIKAVIYHLDTAVRQIGFEFLESSDDVDAYTLENRGGIGKCRSAAQELIKRYNWIRSVAKLPKGSPASFAAKKAGRLWVVSLCPAFEYSAPKDDLLSIPTEAAGIYRYISKSNHVVYIGKGHVRKRAQEAERAEWNFDKIEYSIVDNEKDQFKWENFWIDHYQVTNGDELPAYNRQAGNKR